MKRTVLILSLLLVMPVRQSYAILGGGVNNCDGCSDPGVTFARAAPQVPRSTWQMIWDALVLFW